MEAFLIKSVIHWRTIMLWWWQGRWGSNSLILNMYLKHFPHLIHWVMRTSQEQVSPQIQISLSRQAGHIYGSREASILMVLHMASQSWYCEHFRLDYPLLWGSSYMHFRCLTVSDFYPLDSIPIAYPLPLIVKTKKRKKKKASDIAKCRLGG